MNAPFRYAAIRYLGQAGFSFRVAGLTVLIDPYLSYSVDRQEGFPAGFWERNYAPPVAPADLQEVNLVLCTHDHLEHADPETLQGIRDASPECHFAAPRATVQRMLENGIPASRITVLKEGPVFDFGDVSIEPVASAHEDYEVDADGFDRFLGYILHWGGLNLYHAGDTVLTPRLMNALKDHPVDIAFLPINGRSDGRRRFDVIGNMDGPEAVALARCLALGNGLELVVPTHYDLYNANGATLSGFIDAWEQAAMPKPGFKVFLPGEEMLFQF